MAGFGFSNSPAFSRDPQRAAQLSSTQAPQAYGQQTPYAQQQYGQQAPSPEQLGAMYDRPAATPSDTGRLTYDGVIMKTLVTLAAVAAGFVVQMGLFFTGNATAMQGLMWVGVIAGLGLGIANAVKRNPSPVLVLLFGLAEGLMAGGISVILEWGPFGLSGIIFQALLATASVFAATLALYAFRIVRVTPKLTRFFLIAMLGYVAFSLVNLVLMWTGVTTDPWGMRSFEILGIPLGVILGIFVVLMGAYSLMLDFNNVEIGVQRGVPAVYGWQAAFGLTSTIVWLYVEILRLIAIIRGSN